MKDYSKYVYMGTGYFRDGTVSTKEKADIIHAPELMKMYIELLKKYNEKETK